MGRGTGATFRVERIVPAEVGFSGQVRVATEEGFLPVRVRYLPKISMNGGKDRDGTRRRITGEGQEDDGTTGGRSTIPRMRRSHPSDWLEKKLPRRCEAWRARPPHTAPRRRERRRTRMEGALRRPRGRRRVVHGSEEEAQC